MPDSDGSSILMQIIVLVILIASNAFFAASEIAIISFNDNKLKKMAEDGDKKAMILSKLTSSSSRFLAIIQVGVTLSGFLASAVASQSFANILAEALLFTGIPKSVLTGISVAVITVLLSFVTLVFGELVPKRIAMQKPERISMSVVRPLAFVAAIARPFVWMLANATNLTVRMFGLDPNVEENNVTEEEIRMLVDVGEEKGVIEESEKEMINNIFEFGDNTVDEIMTHRTDVEAIENTASIEQAVQLTMEEGYSRIPVFEEDLDTILGVLYAKDLLKFVGHDLPKNLKLTKMMRPAYFVPESKKCKDLFNELVDKKLQMAIVVDEYGGTSGIVTMEDLMESIVGNMQDEFDDEEEDVTKLSDNSFTIDGTTYLDEVEDLLEQKLPRGEYDTIAGMVVDLLGRIPSVDETPSVVVGNTSFTVQEVIDNRIAKILAVVNEPASLQEEK